MIRELLSNAIMTNDLTEIQRIIALPEFDLNEERDFPPPLHEASEHGRIEIVQLLLKNGADVNIQSSLGTALHYSSVYGHIEVAQLLLKNVANIDIQDSEGHTALHDASNSGRIEIAQLLLNNGANIDIQDSEGHTALHYASLRGRIEIVQLLLNNGADVNIQDSNGRTPLDFANPTLRNMMTNIAVKFQNLYSSFEHAVTSGTIKTWNTPDNTIEMRCAVYNKYLKSQNIDHRVSSDDMQSLIETNFGRDIDLTNFNHPILKEIFCKERTIYSHNWHEFFEDIIPDNPEYIDNENHTAIRMVQNEEIMQLIFSYLDPSDIHTGNAVEVIGGNDVEGHV